MKLPEYITEEKVSKLYNAIDYKKVFNDIRHLADLEWNGSITITDFRDNVNETDPVELRCFINDGKNKRIDDNYSDLTVSSPHIKKEW